MKTKLRDFFGVISEETANQLEENIRKNRKEFNESFNRRVEQIRKDLEGVTKEDIVRATEFFQRINNRKKNRV